MKLRHTAVAALVAVTMPALAATSADAQRLPVMEWNMGVAGVRPNVEAVPGGQTYRAANAWGGLVGGRISLIGLLTRSMSDGRFFVGDQLALELGGIYWDVPDCPECGEGAIRIHLEVGAGGGMVLGNGMQVMARAGVLGESDTSGQTTGWGSYFGAGRVNAGRFSVELGGGPGAGENTGLMFGVGRLRLGGDTQIGLRSLHATRVLKGGAELKEHSFMIFFGIQP